NLLLLFNLSSWDRNRRDLTIAIGLPSSRLESRAMRFVLSTVALLLFSTFLAAQELPAPMRAQIDREVANVAAKTGVPSLSVAVVREIGRASCRERGEGSGGAGAWKKKSRDS